MNSSNFIKGFPCTKIWPLDPTKYPLYRFDPGLLNKSNECKESRAIESNWAELKQQQQFRCFNRLKH